MELTVKDTNGGSGSLEVFLGVNNCDLRYDPQPISSQHTCFCSKKWRHIQTTAKHNEPIAAPGLFMDIREAQKV